jgi:transposase
MLDARREDDSYRRVEVITGQRRRRLWTAEEKARIVAESFEEGANISEVARRHGVARGLLTTSPRNLRQRPGSRRRASCRYGSTPTAGSGPPTGRAIVRGELRIDRRHDDSDDTPVPPGHESGVIDT